MKLSRREYLKILAMATASALPGAAILAAGSAHAKKPSAKIHKPQLHTRFANDAAQWSGCGLYERTFLWPQAGPHLTPPSTTTAAKQTAISDLGIAAQATQLQTAAASLDEWTAYYRYTGTLCEVPLGDLNTEGLYQVFVCAGGVQIKGKEYGPGDFVCAFLNDYEFVFAQAHPGTTLIVKRQNSLVIEKYHPAAKLKAEHEFMSLPFLIPSNDSSGLDLNVQSSYLFGSAFQKTKTGHTVVTMLERFNDQTVAPSHYHPEPIWHEFIYVQGGHLTPDGAYAPGDHVVSLPNCKEGPWLSTLDGKCAYPKQWPVYTEPAELTRAFTTPWPQIYSGKDNGIYGVLFVHGGPFAKVQPFYLSLANWTILDSKELGPEG